MASFKKEFQKGVEDEFEKNELVPMIEKNENNLSNMINKNNQEMPSFSGEESLRKAKEKVDALLSGKPKNEKGGDPPQGILDWIEDERHSEVILKGNINDLGLKISLEDKDIFFNPGVRKELQAYAIEVNKKIADAFKRRKSDLKKTEPEKTADKVESPKEADTVTEGKEKNLSEKNQELIDKMEWETVSERSKGQMPKEEEKEKTLSEKNQEEIESHTWVEGSKRSKSKVEGTLSEKNQEEIDKIEWKTASERAKSKVPRGKEEEDKFYPPVPVDKDKFYPPVPTEFYPPVPVNKKEKIRVGIFNVDEIAKSYAWRIAEEKLREILHSPEKEMKSGGRMKSLLNNLTVPFRHPKEFFKKSWVRAAEQGYLYKFYTEALEEITKNQNLLLQIEGDWKMGKEMNVTDAAFGQDQHFEILDKVIEEYSNNVAEMEEKGNNIASNPEVDTAFQDLIARYYSEDWDRKKFEEEQRLLINNLRKDGHLKDEDFLGDSKRNTKEVSGGHMFASSLFSVAEDYKKHIDQKVEELNQEHNLTPEQRQLILEHIKSTFQLDISLGAKFSDLHNKRPADTLRGIEKFVEWTQKKPILRRIASNPGSMAVMAALGSGAATRGITKAGVALGVGSVGLVTGAWVPVLAAGAAAGVYGAMRRNLEMKKDRAMHQRQRITGQEFSDNRRGKMEEFQYDVKTTGEMQNELQEIMKAGDFATLNPDQKGQLVSMFARFKTEYSRDLDYRINKKPNRTVDLIAVSEEEGDKYGTNLMSKTDLKSYLYAYLRENSLIAGDRTELAQNEEFNKLFNQEYVRLNENIDINDKAFDKHRRKSALLAGSISGLAGAAGAIVGQEIMSNIGHTPKYTAWDDLKNRFGSGSEKISQAVPGFATVEMQTKTFNNWDDFVKGTGYENSQRVSYSTPFFQETAPQKGIRALPENLKNLFNNRQLNANATELMMDYKSGENGQVIVDASKMFGKILKGSAGEDGLELQKALSEGKKFFLNLSMDNAVGGSQHNPIMLQMRPDGRIVVPRSLANVFFGYDEKGNLLKGPGNHPGLHQLVLDTGERRPKDGAAIVRAIASTLGEKPELVQDEIVPSKIPGSEIPIGLENPWTVSASVPSSRWQLEDSVKKQKEARPSRKKTAGERVDEIMKKKSEEQDQEKPATISSESAGPSAEVDENDLSPEPSVVFDEGSSSQEEKKPEKPAETTGGKTQETEAEKVKSQGKEAIYTLDGIGAKVALEKYSKHFLRRENLEKIVGSNKLGDITREVEDMANDEKQGMDKAISLLKDKYLGFFEKFKKQNKIADIKFGEFIYCLREGLKGYSKFNILDKINVEPKEQ